MIKKLLDIALAEEGYLEKASNSQLDSKTANAGNRNYTKYARDLDNTPNFYNGKKNGYPWCDVFVDWCFVKAFGVDQGRALLCQPLRSSGAGCGASANYYKQKGQFHKSNPKVGDQIFFLDSAGDVGHTGLVYEVDNARVYTIEGNTSGASGVIANGGGVCKKSYDLNYNRIYGYGRPAYIVEDDNKPEEEARRILRKGAKGEDVRYAQNRLLAHGEKLPEYGADADFGTETYLAVISFQGKHNLEQDGEIGPLTWAELEKEPKTLPTLRRGSKGQDVKDLQNKLIKLNYDLSQYGADADFGGETENAVKEFQKDNNLTVNGVVDSKTWAAFETAKPRIRYDVIITANSGLNVRKGPGTGYGVLTALRKGTRKTIVQEQNGWGKLSDMNGWISLSYARKV